MPPNACASDWWPRQTPSVGTPASGKRRIASTEMPASLGVHGPGETTTRSHVRAEQVVDGGDVVAHGLDLRPQLPQVLDEVVGEGVVVVDDEDALTATLAASAASSIARTTPRALARDSSYS